MSKKFRGTANPALARALRDLRRSGAAGTHNDRRYRRARTRSAKKRRELKDFDAG